jgi:hypothetical protein
MKKLTKKQAGKLGGKARWKGKTKKQRSEEMSRVAKLMWVKLKAGNIDKIS